MYRTIKSIISFPASFLLASTQSLFSTFGLPFVLASFIRSFGFFIITCIASAFRLPSTAFAFASAIIRSLIPNILFMTLSYMFAVPFRTAAYFGFLVLPRSQTSCDVMREPEPASHPAHKSHRSSFSQNSPLVFRISHLFSSSTLSDISLAASLPSPSPSRGPLRPLPSLGNRSSASSISSCSDVFDWPAARLVTLPSRSSGSTSISAISPTLSSSFIVTDAPVHAPFMPPSLSAWDLAEGTQATDEDTSSTPRRLFGIPIEDLPAYSYSPSSSDFSEKEQAYLCTALGIYEASSMPLKGYCTAPLPPRTRRTSPRRL